MRNIMSLTLRRIQSLTKTMNRPMYSLLASAFFNGKLLGLDDEPEQHLLRSTIAEFPIWHFSVDVQNQYSWEDM